jgi:uracil-DNA glycosylase family 4
LDTGAAVSWKDKIRDPDCTLCPLHESAEYVCLMGAGKRRARIMVVGEAPGQREDDSGQAFVGPAGRLLDEVLGSAGLSRDECYITNVAKCRPPENRAPEWGTEAKVCSNAYLSEEIRVVQPEYILALGNTALKALTGKSGITKHRGTRVAVGNAWVIPAFHPAYILRSPFHRSALDADVQKLARLYRGDAELDSAKPTRIKIARTVAHLKWLRSKLMQVPVISYDIETNFHRKVQEYADWHPEWRIVSISFSWEEGQAVVVPLHHPDTPWKDPNRALRFLKPCLERTDARYIAHNGKFDARGLSRVGVFVPQTFDTMLAAHMIEENRLKGLEPLSEILLGIESYKIGVGDKGAHNFRLADLCKYNGQDTDYTMRLYNFFKPELEKEPRIKRVFTKLMMPASNALTRVEAIGVYIDPERYDDRLDATVAKRDEVEAELRRSCGDINLRSPQQVAKWIFGELGLPIIQKTKKGAPSTAESVILRLAREHPELRLLLEYRKWETKYLRTYFAQWANVDKNHRFHAQYKLFGTVTGRLSGDFQQVPRDPFMRSIIGAPPGWTFVEADYSQVELRIAAWLANERNMLSLFAMGEDIHLATAVQVSGKRPEDITSEERKKAKAVNFGFLYGMGAPKFQSYAFDNYGVVVSDAEAQAARSRFFEAYPGLLPWHDRQRRLVHRYGRVHSPLGRVRHLPTVQSSDRGVVAEAERQAINSPVQSCASDIMLLSLVRLHALLPQPRARIVGTVHDSILFEVRDDYVDAALPQIKETMEDLTELERKFGARPTVPIDVEIKVSQHWGEGNVWKEG